MNEKWLGRDSIYRKISRQFSCYTSTYYFFTELSCALGQIVLLFSRMSTKLYSNLFCKNYSHLMLIYFGVCYCLKVLLVAWEYYPGYFSFLSFITTIRTLKSHNLLAHEEKFSSCSTANFENNKNLDEMSVSFNIRRELHLCFKKLL